MAIFKNKKIKENEMKFELILKTLRVPYEKKNGLFVLTQNKYLNNGNSYTNLLIEVNEEGISFFDPAKRPLSKIDKVVSISNATSEILNVFGVLSRKALVTK